MKRDAPGRGHGGQDRTAGVRRRRRPGTAEAGRRGRLRIGDPLPFERPYWSGDRPADVVPWPGEEDEPYALPFHPLELGEDALRALCGFIQEGLPDPADVDADAIRLHGFHVGAPHTPELAPATRASERPAPPGRFYTLTAEGTLVERDAP
ncbi:DUF6928 family protein [Streptomyces cellulosae]